MDDRQWACFNLGIFCTLISTAFWALAGDLAPYPGEEDDNNTGNGEDRENNQQEEGGKGKGKLINSHRIIPGKRKR